MVDNSRFFKSSKTFREKIILPLRSCYRVDSDSTYLAGELNVRRYNGFYWCAYKKKICVLLKCGRLFIYSTVDRGLSINMFELHEVKQKYENKNIVGMEASARCEFELFKGNDRICLRIEGQRWLVTAWRRGIVCSHQGIELGEARETDEMIWAQSIVHPKASDALFSTLANRSLRINKSFPSLYNTYCHPGRKQSSLIYSGFRCSKIYSLDSDTGIRMHHSHSFCVPTHMTERPEFCVDTLSEIVATTKPENCARKTTIDSDASPHFTDDVFNLEEQESHIKTRKRCQFDLREDECLNKTQSRCRAVLSGIPMLRAEMLNFDAVFE